MGWSLGGMSAIIRGPKTIYNDNAVEGVSFTSGDKFALDGSRLILTSGNNYGDPSSQYHTENETFKTIVANGSLGNGPASFTVTDQNGWTYQYGETSNSLIIPTNVASPYAWLLDKVTDLNGNYMTFEYSQGAFGEVNISKINYEANANAGVAPQAYVTFNYVSRFDIQYMFVGGGTIGSTKVLKTIDCYQMSNSVARMAHNYNLNYSGVGPYSHLFSVTEGGQDGNQTLSPTQFTYGDAGSYWSAPHSELAQQQTPNLNLTFAVGDYNGDGRADIIQYSTQTSNSSFSLYLNNGVSSTFTLAQTGTLQQEAGFGNFKNNLPSAIGQPFDYDGDGKADFFYQQANGANITSSAISPGLQPQQKPWIYLSTGSGLKSNPIDEIAPAADPTYYHSDIFAGLYPLIGDFDGDGRSEILEIATTQNIGAASPISYLIGQLYNTPGMNLGDNTNVTTPHAVNVPYKFDNVTHPFLPFNSDNSARFYAIDYNGDGKTDIMQVVNNSTTIWEFNVSFDANHNPIIGNPAFIQVINIGYPTHVHDIFPGDFNGDHITDFLTYTSSAGWQIGYGRGNGDLDIESAPNTHSTSPDIGSGHFRPVFVGDFNGDGKDDIYDAESGSQAPTLYYSYGYNEFTTEVPPVNTAQTGTNGDQNYWMGDFSGDGSTAILSQGPLYY